MHNKRRTHRLKTDNPNPSLNLTKPFQSSISSILIDKCQKCTQELQKSSLKAAKQIIGSIDKDLALLNASHTDYARLMSLVYNTKAGYYRKNGENQEALKCIDEAIAVERYGNIDRIDMARTLLNKSVIMGQMAREDKNMYSHETAIALAKEALEIIKNRPEGKQFVHKDQYKLGEIIIISFHNIATELVCLKNQAEGYNLYKKAYDLALRVLGPRHNLTVHLKNIIAQYKDQKRKLHTEQTSPQLKNSSSKIMGNSQVTKSLKKTNFVQENKKFKNFFKIYGYSKDNSFNQDVSEQLDMKDLNKIKKMYTPVKTNSYFPDIKRKSIRDIINQGRDLATKRPYVASVTQKEKEKEKAMGPRTSKNSSRNGSKKKLQKLRTQEIQLPPEQKNEKLQILLNSKLAQKQPQKKAPLKQPALQQKGGCQLI